MKTAKLFRNGRSQAVRLPREFRFAGDSVFIRKSGRAVVLLPVSDSWDSWIDSLGKFSDDFMTERHQAAPQKRRRGFA